MMRRGVMLAGIALLAALALAAPAQAITYGEPDGKGHPKSARCSRRWPIRTARG